MESIIKDALTEHLLDNGLILPSQHGFIPGRSCVTNLLTYLNEVTTALDSGVPYDVIMVDFRRAFDVVPFDLLLIKLEAHGILGELLHWFDDWTKGRQQRVVINGHSSGWADVISSVVQGSVIGPVLFLLFINDIDCVVDGEGTKMFKYADDSKFGRRIRSDKDVIALQSDLDGVAHWAVLNGMALHPQKTMVIHFGYNNPRHRYTLYGTEVESSACVKDLGILINEKCTPEDHVAAIAKRANCILGQIRRSTINRSVNMVTKMYKTYVRPLIESSVQAWNPWLQRDIDHLEKVQRRATKLITGIGSKSYDERLAICGLSTLEKRRLRGDMLQCYKILNGFTNINTTDFFSYASDRHSINTRSAMEDLLVPEKNRLDVRKYFFTSRVVNDWNEIPLEIRTASSINSFKNNYDMYCSECLQD